MLAVSALLLALSANAQAARQGHPERASHGVVVTTAEINGESMGRMPRREQPDEHESEPPPKSTDGASPKAGGLRTSTRPAVRATALTSPSSFEGPSVNDSGAYPPDTQGDVGPTQYIVTINGRFRSYSKATGLPDNQLEANPSVFFDSVMTPIGGAITGNFTSDPHIRYDRLSHHWFAVMIDVPDNGFAQNRIMVAVSEDATITSSTVWHLFFFSSPTGEFADYPTLGIDANALYIGTNDFPDSPGDFINSDAYVVRKTSLIGSDPSAPSYLGPLVVTPFLNVINLSNVGPFTPQGVDNPTPGASTGYFIGADNGTFGQLDLVPVTSPGGIPTLGAMQPITVPRTRYPRKVSYLGAPGNTPSDALDALDDRLYAAQIRNGHLWTAHNVGATADGTSPLNAPDVDRTVSRWYDITLANPAAAALNKSGTVVDSSATNPRSFWIPTVAVNGQGTMAMGGSTAGNNARPDAWFSSLQPGDSALAAPTLYTSSSFNYAPPFTRWGDYSMTSVDPTDDQTMWTIQEYVTATDTWGTRIAKLLAPAPAAPASASPSNVPRGTASAHITLSASAAAGWFDPGAAFPNHFAVSDSCGAPISNLSLTGANTATFDIDIHTLTNSTCDFTVTNPDGQSSTGTALFTADARPVATADSYTLPGGATFNGTGLLANDTDADDSSLTAAGAAAPAHGTVAVSPGGSFTYTPAAGFSGDDAFTYTAGDGLLSSIPAAVTLHVLPQPAPPPGNPKVRCVVPKLRGLTLTAARRALTKAHCKVGKVRKVRRGSGKHGRVISSSPGAGRRLAAGSAVALVVRR